MSTDSEEMQDEAVNGREALQVGGGLASTHLLLTLPRRLVGHFGSVVRIAVRAVDHRRHHGPTGRRVAAQLVGDQPPRRPALALQRFAKEPHRRPPIAPRLHEDVEHVAVLVDRPPESLLPPLDVHEQLIEMPRVAHPTPPAPRIRRAKRATPLPHRLVGHGDPALSAQGFRIAEAETKAVVELDGVADDLGRESIAVVARRVVGHRSTLPATVST